MPVGWIVHVMSVIIISHDTFFFVVSFLFFLECNGDGDGDGGGAKD